MRSVTSFLEGFRDFMREMLANHSEEFGQEFSDLWALQEERIGIVLERLDARDYDQDRLREVGLADQQGDFEVRVFEASRNAYQADPTPLRALDVLEAANITLGSLTLVFPILQSVEELKSIGEFMLSRGRDWVKRWLWPL